MQKKVQDERSKVTEKTLKIGTKVMIQNDGIIKKLDARYRGPYTVVGITPKKNYLLNDMTGQRVDTSIPLHKLKVTNFDDKDEFMEIDKILDHKISDGNELFLVKWKNNLEKSSWEPAENFANMKIINDYKSSLNKSTVRRKRGRPKKNILTTTLACLYLFLLFLPIVLATEGEVIKDFGNFELCDLAHSMTPIDVGNLCHYEEKEAEASALKIIKWLNKNDNTNYSLDDFKRKRWKSFILTKEMNAVEGKAFQCKVEKYAYTWHENLLGDKLPYNSKTYVDLTLSDCHALVETKNCYGNKMKCDGDVCKFNDPPVEDYSYFVDKTTITYHCYIVPRWMSAKNIDSHVFGANCLVKDWKCQGTDSITIWNTEVVHSCPFKIVKEGLFKLDGQYIRETQAHLAFQFKSIENHCESEFIETTEGLFLAHKPVSKYNLDRFQNEKDIKGLVDLMLADGDFKTVYLLDEQRKSLQRECNNFALSLKLFSLSEDKFIKLKDWQGNDVIIYAKHGQVFHPKCKKIDKIILKNVTNCYDDVPILFQHSNEWIPAYLTADSVIRLVSKQRQCNDVIKYIRLFNTSIQVALSGNKVWLVDSKNIEFDKIKFFNNVAFRNLSHMSIITAGVDIIGKMQNLSFNTEIDGIWLTQDTGESSSKSMFSGIENILDSFKTEIRFIIACCIVAFIIYIMVRTGLLSACFRLLKNKCSKCIANRCKNNLTKAEERDNNNNKINNKGKNNTNMDVELIEIKTAEKEIIHEPNTSANIALRDTKLLDRSTSITTLDQIKAYIK